MARFPGFPVLAYSPIPAANSLRPRISRRRPAVYSLRPRLTMITVAHDSYVGFRWRVSTHLNHSFKKLSQTFQRSPKSHVHDFT